MMVSIFLNPFSLLVKLLKFFLFFAFYIRPSVINQHYQPEILTEYVIRGNSGILKCSIPSFVSDFVRVESWIDEEGNELDQSESYG